MGKKCEARAGPQPDEREGAGPHVHGLTCTGANLNSGRNGRELCPIFSGRTLTSTRTIENPDQCGKFRVAGKKLSTST